LSNFQNTVLAVPRKKGGSLVVAAKRDFLFLDLEVCSKSYQFS